MLGSVLHHRCGTPRRLCNLLADSHMVAPRQMSRSHRRCGILHRVEGCFPLLSESHIAFTVTAREFGESSVGQGLGDPMAGTGRRRRRTLAVEGSFMVATNRYGGRRHEQADMIRSYRNGERRIDMRLLFCLGLTVVTMILTSPAVPQQRA